MLVKTLHQRSRSAAIVADAAYAIMCQPSDGPMSGIFAIDEVVLRAQGIHDLTQYAVISRDLDLAVDLFVDEKKTYNVPPMVKVLQSFYSLQSKI